MTEDQQREEARREARFQAAQKRHVATNAALYGWRDGTHEVEIASVLVVLALTTWAAHTAPFRALHSLRVEVVALLLAVLVALVEFFAAGFRYHISQSVGGLVGRRRSGHLGIVAPAIALGSGVAVLVASLLRLPALRAEAVSLPLGVIGGALAIAIGAAGVRWGYQRLLVLAAVLASLGWLWDSLLARHVLREPLGVIVALLVLAVPPLVSGVLGFHGYRREVDEHHDEFVADAAAMLASPSATRRAVAADALGHLGGLDAVEPLVVALGDSDEDVRLAAAFALAEIRELVPARLVARRLDSRGFVDGDEVPVETLAQVAQLAMLEWQDMLAEEYRIIARQPGIIEGLFAASAADQPGVLRRTAMRVLAEIREPVAVGRLVEILTGRAPELHASARGALAWTGPSGARALAPLLGDERDWVRREAAAALLGVVRYAKDADETRVQQRLAEGTLPEATLRAGDPAEEWWQVAELSQAAFAGAIYDSDRLVREAAAIAMDLLGEAQASIR